LDVVSGEDGEDWLPANAGTFEASRYVEQDTTEGKRPLVTTAVAPSTPLSAVDRCDRCGAQAYLRVELTGGGELLFCAHHAREHGDKLREIAVHVHDETEKLSATPTVASDGER
jgi:hypothetical protein